MAVAALSGAVGSFAEQDGGSSGGFFELEVGGRRIFFVVIDRERDGSHAKLGRSSVARGMMWLRHLSREGGMRGRNYTRRGPGVSRSGFISSLDLVKKKTLERGSLITSSASTTRTHARELLRRAIGPGEEGQLRLDTPK